MRRGRGEDGMGGRGIVWETGWEGGERRVGGRRGLSVKGGRRGCIV